MRQQPGRGAGCGFCDRAAGRGSFAVMQGAVQSLPDLTAALKKSGAAAVVLLRYPMPTCADPRGYWNSILDLSGLLLAEVPLKDVPSFEKKLDAELKKTT